MNTAAKIFVSVASYRDTELLPTLENMFSEAEHPQHLHISICWQDDLNIQPFINKGMTLVETFSHADFVGYSFEWQGAAIDVIAVNYFNSKGACWARSLAESRYSQESYFMQIDSHSRFITHWDSVMINTLESLRLQSERPVLSCYPPGYTFNKAEQEERQSYTSRVVFAGFNNDKIPKFKPHIFTASAPLRTCFLAGGYIFADGHFAKNVPNDPEIFFMGEEISMAVRAFTHGYDIWSPHITLLWHYYTRKDHPKIWGDHSNEAKQKGLVRQAWWEIDKTSKERIKNVIGLSEDDEVPAQFNLGNKRTIDEYQYRSGIDFKNQYIHPEIAGTEKKTYFTQLPDNHEQWLASLHGYVEKKIRIAHDEINTTAPGVVRWHVGVYNGNNQAVMIQQNSTKEFIAQLKNTDDIHYEFNLVFSSSWSLDNLTLRICPWHEEDGWGTVLEKPL
ncbi:glycosyltransferase [Enterobacteriaceae bacterium 4M9]|nr:glycosyltransferase [Enterobacteriaceae bacterium 4M9]